MQNNKKCNATALSVIRQSTLNITSLWRLGLTAEVIHNKQTRGSVRDFFYDGVAVLHLNKQRKYLIPNSIVLYSAKDKIDEYGIQMPLKMHEGQFALVAKSKKPKRLCIQGLCKEIAP